VADVENGAVEPKALDEKEQSELDAQMEEFQKEYRESFDDENFDNERSQSELDGKQDDQESKEEDQVVTARTETRQESDSGEAEPEQKEEAAPKQKPKMVTLPDDESVFGDLAGKKVTYEQLLEEGYLDKFASWGHQGRLMLSKSQEELDEARKMREAIESQVELMKESFERQNAPPPLSAEEEAKLRIEKFLPLMQKYADAGGVESTFLENYPKASAYIEDRLQGFAEVGQALIRVIDEIKQNVDPLSETSQRQASKSVLQSLAKNVASEDEFFGFLGEDEGYRDFMKWATAEDSTLHWVDRDVTKVTPQDLMSSALLYIRQHPEKFKKTSDKPKVSEEQRLQATGGKGQSKAAPRRSDDEISNFMKEYSESFQSQEF
jgi:hypothetical protein